MLSELQGILKKSAVKPGLPCRIGAADGAGPSSAPAKVRIVKQDRGVAMIEVTCPCGKKTYVECSYPE